ncbi:MAG: hypothetical protein ACPGXK_00610 [Phycisphaerae bacterium]
MSASSKLGETDAEELLGTVKGVAVAKGKKVTLFPSHQIPKIEKNMAAFDGFKVEKAEGDHATFMAHLLGSTGNLRAPTIVVGKNLLVGFNEAMYESVLG